MATILLLLTVVFLSAAYVLAKGPRDPEDPADPWEAPPAGRSMRRTPRSMAPPPMGKHGDRRYHDVDYPFHRRRTDGYHGEI